MQNRKRDTDVQNRLLDSLGEGKGGMFWENSIETSILSRVKQITSPGSIDFWEGKIFVLKIWEFHINLMQEIRIDAKRVIYKQPEKKIVIIIIGWLRKTLTELNSLSFFDRLVRLKIRKMQQTNKFQILVRYIKVSCDILINKIYKLKNYTVRWTPNSLNSYTQSF